MKERTAFPRILESNFRWMIVLMATATGSFLSDTLDAKTRNDALSREKMRGEWAIPVIGFQSGTRETFFHF